MERDICSFAYVIFDGDGTLWRGQTIYRKMLPYLLQIPLGWLTSDVWISSGAVPVPSWLTWLDSMPGVRRTVKTADRFVSKALSLVEELVRRRSLYEGTEEALRKLKEQGKVLFLSTGSPDPRRFLQDCDLLRCFTAVQWIETGKRHHIRLFADVAGVSLEEFGQRACMISDGPADLFVAKRHGMYCIGLSQTLTAPKLFYFGADKVVSNLPELFS